MITSVHNQQIKEIILLNSKRRERDRSGLFTAEGIKLFQEAPRELIERVFVSASFERGGASLLKDTGYETVEDSVFSKMCDTKTPQGILTVLKKPRYERGDLLGPGQPFIMVLEELQDPGNIGTIVRTAEGAGVTGIILSKGCADIFSPKTIRSTMGSVFRIPFIYEEDLAETLSWLSANGVHTYGAHLSGACLYNEPDYKTGTAFLIGNEGNGLSAAISEKCDTLITIPMEGKLESLNAAVASAILMYTVHSQRN